jgi:hypothetical protein
VRHHEEAMAMTIIHIEHPVRDFDAWKAAFDSDPIGREAGGVRRYRIFRSVSAANDVAIDLEFDDRATAESFRAALDRMWTSPRATAALSGVPRAELVDIVEERAY